MADFGDNDPTRVHTVDDDDDDDPIVATYSVFMKPPLQANKRLLILQYVNKTAQDPTSIRQPEILEMRVKPKTGMLEVDVPIDTSHAYDQAKGIKWGTILQKSMDTKKGGSLGLAGGFGIGAPAVRPAGGRRGGEDNDTQMSWPEAKRLDKVLRIQTLGGGRSTEEENAKYMVGVFQGKNIHLTPVSSLIHLRPVPHHVDAVTEQEKLSRPTPAGTAAAAAAEKSAGRAIQMTLKNAMDDEGVATETMADRLRSVQTESWRRMDWHDDETGESWEAYKELFLMRPEVAADAAQEEVEEGKGKGKEVANKKPVDDSGAADLVERVTQLRTDWGEDELLRAVSGIKPGDPKPGEEAVTRKDSEKEAVSKGKGKEPAPVAIEKQPEEPRKRPGRPARGAAATAAAPKRGRARVASGSGAADAMEID
ncbi:Sin-like protein conserved region-domain-containing protein [Podospora aff. communis PSN243]|uniref:Sin-like protein conserved region-domain-containing protein n=1 Tax=Podospora aff. communis PSN243 TaxID=3040156 RepID=A0AAV9H5E0_9PEZI|nr:Sin-like protein conserved region-domain-containing protein [Podospora aff. communis PSN243]